MLTGRTAELAPVLAAHRDVDALDLARRFHDDVRARVPAVRPLPEPVPAGPPTLFLKDPDGYQAGVVAGVR